MRASTAVTVALIAAATALSGQEVVAYVGATLWDGTSAAPVPDATVVVRDGRVVAAGRVQAPPEARVEDLSGRWIVPGFVNTHGHISGRWAPPGTTDPTERVRGDLRLFARYGVTTVVSLGDEPEAAFGVRERNHDPALDHARLFVAGPVIGGRTVAEARAAVRANARAGVDWIKIRVDDNLGTTEKMPREAARAVIQEGHAQGLRVASHLFYLEDAKALLTDGVDLIAHSVRDADVDDELLDLLRDQNVCYVPTLVREVSTFVYAERPAFFDDPFFQAHADRAEVQRLSTPEFREAMRQSPAAARYRRGLIQAQGNLKRLVDAGAPVAFGTDAGVAARFPGYFEHMELALMVEAGLTPEQALRSATGVAAECLGLEDIGTLEPGRWADFLVLHADPLERIDATRELEAVFVAGNRVR